MAKVANEVLNIIVSKLVNHDWDQISSGSWHRTLSGIAVAFKLLEDVNDVELVALLVVFNFEKFWIRYLELK